MAELHDGQTWIVDMDKVVDMLHRADTFAYVEQTGGGTATIYAGHTFVESDYGTRYAALAGPGWFEGPGWTIARGYAADFYVGPDDEGDANPWEPNLSTLVDEDPTDSVEAAIAAQILRVIKEDTHAHS